MSVCGGLHEIWEKRIQVPPKAGLNPIFEISPLAPVGH